MNQNNIVKVLNVFSEETMNKSSEYLYEENSGYAFFKFKKGTLFSKHVDGIIELFSESGTGAKEGFLLTPTSEVRGAILEVEKVFPNGDSIQTNTSCDEIRNQFNILL